MKDFEYYAPRSVDDAISLLSTGRKNAKVLAGGTDLVVQMKDRRVQPSVIVDVKNIPELNRLKVDKDGTLHVGAAVPLMKIVDFAPVKKKFKMLQYCCSIIGSVQIRNRATMGGNVCNAAPSADSIPALLCLEARAIVAQPNGTRMIPLEQFFSGPGKTVLDDDELLMEIEIPAPPPRSAGSYLRHTPREEMDIAAVGVASFIVLSPRGKTCREARIALGAVAPTPIRAIKAESYLSGKTIDDATIEKAAELAAEAAKPISDVRASAKYRIELVKALTRKTLNEAMANISSGIKGE